MSSRLDDDISVYLVPILNLRLRNYSSKIDLIGHLFIGLKRGSFIPRNTYPNEGPTCGSMDRKGQSAEEVP